MKFTRTMILAALGLTLTLTACGEPMTRTTSASETRTTTPSGGESSRQVNETREQGSDGQGTERRSVTTEQSTPAH